MLSNSKMKLKVEELLSFVSTNYVYSNEDPVREYKQKLQFTMTVSSCK